MKAIAVQRRTDQNEPVCEWRVSLEGWGFEEDA